MVNNLTARLDNEVTIYKLTKFIQEYCGNSYCVKTNKSSTEESEREILKLYFNYYSICSKSESPCKIFNELRSKLGGIRFFSKKRKKRKRVFTKSSSKRDRILYSNRNYKVTWTLKNDPYQKKKIKRSACKPLQSTVNSSDNLSQILSNFKTPTDNNDTKNNGSMALCSDEALNYQEKQSLKPLPKATNSNEKFVNFIIPPENDPINAPAGCCEVCWEPLISESIHKRPSYGFVVCSICSVSVHKSCYGLQWVSETTDFASWHCSLCSYWIFRGYYHVDKQEEKSSDSSVVPPVADVKQNIPRASCALCLRPGGAMRIGPEGLWVHVHCVYYCSEGPYFSIPLRVQRPLLIRRSLALHSVKQFKCSICNDSHGFTCRCGYPNCNLRVHIPCAYVARCNPKSEPNPSLRRPNRNMKIVSCLFHSNCYNAIVQHQNELFSLADELDIDWPMHLKRADLLRKNFAESLVTERQPLGKFKRFWKPNEKFKNKTFSQHKKFRSGSNTNISRKSRLKYDEEDSGRQATLRPSNFTLHVDSWMSDYEGEESSRKRLRGKRSRHPKPYQVSHYSNGEDDDEELFGFNAGNKQRDSLLLNRRARRVASGRLVQDSWSSESKENFTYMGTHIIQRGVRLKWNRYESLFERHFFDLENHSILPLHTLDTLNLSENVQESLKKFLTASIDRKATFNLVDLDKKVFCILENNDSFFSMCWLYWGELSKSLRYSLKELSCSEQSFDSLYKTFVNLINSSEFEKNAPFLIKEKAHLFQKLFNMLKGKDAQENAWKISSLLHFWKSLPSDLVDLIQVGDWIAQRNENVSADFKLKLDFSQKKKSVQQIISAIIALFIISAYADLNIYLLIPKVEGVLSSENINLNSFSELNKNREPQKNVEKLYESWLNFNKSLELVNTKQPIGGKEPNLPISTCISELVQPWNTELVDTRENSYIALYDTKTRMLCEEEKLFEESETKQLLEVPSEGTKPICRVKSGSSTDAKNANLNKSVQLGDYFWNMSQSLLDTMQDNEKSDFENLNFVDIQDDYLTTVYNYVVDQLDQVRPKIYQAILEDEEIPKRINETPELMASIQNCYQIVSHWNQILSYFIWGCVDQIDYEFVEPYAVERHEALCLPMKSKSKELVARNNKYCCVCFGCEWDSINTMLTCLRCCISVHRGCCGLKENYNDEDSATFHCFRCTYERKIMTNFMPGSIRCCLCNTLGGSIVKTTCSQWVHLNCAVFFLPETIPKNLFIFDEWEISGLQSWRFEADCSICSVFKLQESSSSENSTGERLYLSNYPQRISTELISTRRGACIECSHSSCTKKFHVMCAWLVGMFFSLSKIHDQYYPWTTEFDNFYFNKLNTKVYCFDHLPNHQCSTICRTAVQKCPNKRSTPYQRSLRLRHFMNRDIYPEIYSEIKRTAKLANAAPTPITTQPTESTAKDQEKTNEEVPNLTEIMNFKEESVKIQYYYEFKNIGSEDILGKLMEVCKKPDSSELVQLPDKFKNTYCSICFLPDQKNLFHCIRCGLNVHAVCYGKCTLLVTETEKTFRSYLKETLNVDLPPIGGVSTMALDIYKSKIPTFESFLSKNFQFGENFVENLKDVENSEYELQRELDTINLELEKLLNEPTQFGKGNLSEEKQHTRQNENLCIKKSLDSKASCKNVLYLNKVQNLDLQLFFKNLINEGDMSVEVVNYLEFDRNFTCDVCAEPESVEDVSCILCTRKLGAMIKINLNVDSKNLYVFAHIICIKFCPGLKLSSSLLGTKMEGLENILLSSLYNGHKCSLCNLSKGITIPCMWPECKVMSHPICLKIHCCLLQEIYTKNKTVDLISCCSTHSFPKEDSSLKKFIYWSYEIDFCFNKIFDRVKKKLENIKNYNAHLESQFKSSSLSKLKEVEIEDSALKILESESVDIPKSSKALLQSVEMGEVIVENSLEEYILEEFKSKSLDTYVKSLSDVNIVGKDLVFLALFAKNKNLLDLSSFRDLVLKNSKTIFKCDKLDCVEIDSNSVKLFLEFCKKLVIEADEVQEDNEMEKMQLDKPGKRTTSGVTSSIDAPMKLRTTRLTRKNIATEKTKTEMKPKLLTVNHLSVNDCNLFPDIAVVQSPHMDAILSLFSNEPEQKILNCKKVNEKNVHFNQQIIHILNVLRCAQNNKQVPLLALIMIDFGNQQLFAQTYKAALAGQYETLNQFHNAFTKRLVKPLIQNDNIIAIWDSFNKLTNFLAKTHRTRSSDSTTATLSMNQGIIMASNVMIQIIKHSFDTLGSSSDLNEPLNEIPNWNFKPDDWKGLLVFDVYAIGQEVRFYDTQTFIWVHALVISYDSDHVGEAIQVTNKRKKETYIDTSCAYLLYILNIKFLVSEDTQCDDISTGYTEWRCLRTREIVCFRTDNPYWLHLVCQLDFKLHFRAQLYKLNSFKCVCCNRTCKDQFYMCQYFEHYETYSKVCVNQCCMLCAADLSSSRENKQACKDIRKQLFFNCFACPPVRNL